MKFRNILGIDFGGSGIKGAPVDTKKGKLLEKRYRIPTPSRAKPSDVSDVIVEIVEHFRWKGPIGLAFPAVVKNGVVKSAVNIDNSWINLDAANLISKKVGLPAFVINDADAAGMAEMKFGAGKGKTGTVFLVTVGTGLGTVLFTQGKLVPNIEFGHIYLNNGVDAELVTSDAARKRESLSWDVWSTRFDNYLREIERLAWPELIIIGGGVSKKKEEFLRHLSIDTEVVIAKTKNEAGIIGAALFARAYRKIFKFT